jgi:hypothetical protein
MRLRLARLKSHELRYPSHGAPLAPDGWCSFLDHLPALSAQRRRRTNRETAPSGLAGEPDALTTDLLHARQCAWSSWAVKQPGVK